MQENNTPLPDILSQLSLQITPQFSSQIAAYLNLLDRWNRAYNLTAIQDPYDRMIKHIADSLSVLPYLHTGKNWLDVGSGAGLPGIPLALAQPDRQWVLLDGNIKKTQFLTQVKAVLKLENVTVVHSKVELFKTAQLFDGVICRAWTSLSEMIEKTRHLCKPDSYLWAMKGIYPTEELAMISQPYEIYSLRVPHLNEQRHLVRIAMGAL